MQSILIIEDEAELRDGLSDILRFEGFKVLEASDGVEGIAVAKKKMPDLVLCDIMMPKKDGFAVIKELKQDANTAIIPFIFLTAITQKEKRREAMNAGADDYLEKPFSREELLQSIKARITKSNHHKKVAEKHMTNYRERMISHVPHELRTPLNSILGFSELLMNDADLLDKGQIGNMAKIINANGERLFTIVKKYLLFLELEFTKNQLDFHAISLSREGILDIAVNIAASYKREEDLIIEPGDERGKVIINLFRFAIYELVDNAFKFSEAGSKVRIMVEKDENNVIVKVLDEGRGFPYTIKNISAFNQYNRDEFEQQGLGLGLYLSERIVKLHKGALLIENRKDKGAMVQFNMPLS